MTQNQVDQSSMQFMGEVEQLHKGTWLQEEDERLIYFVQLMGDKKWDSLAKASGLRRSGKSCRLRWVNYLRPNLKRGQISVEEENIILQLHEKWGNKWSKIARRLPGRTDNEIKNYWRSCLRKKNNSNIAQQAQESHEVKNNEGKEELLLYDENKNESISTSSPNDSKHDISCEDYSWISSSSSEFELANSYSPYENRFKDWISKYYSLNDQQQSEVNNQNESCNNNSVVGLIDDESCWSNSLDYNSSCTWEYSGSLWDVN